MNRLSSEQKAILLTSSESEWGDVKAQVPWITKSYANSVRVKNNVPKFLDESLRRYNVNEDFFKNKSLDACYWAGLIAADGNINSPSGSRTRRLTISLNGEDAVHLRNLQNELQCSYAIRADKNGNPCGRIEVCRDAICEDLDNIFNIKERKSKCEIPPSGLNYEQSCAFIAGLVDGDGCYKIAYSNNTPRPALQISCGQEMLEWVAATTLPNSVVSIKPDCNTYRLSAAGDKAIKIREQYIAMDLPFLPRKYKLWERRGVDMRMRGTL